MIHTTGSSSGVLSARVDAETKATATTRHWKRHLQTQAQHHDHPAKSDAPLATSAKKQSAATHLHTAGLALHLAVHAAQALQAPLHLHLQVDSTHMKQ